MKEASHWSAPSEQRKSDSEEHVAGALRRIDSRTGEIRRMFVTHAARREGVARALLARLEAEAIALGYRRLLLETGQRQKPAMALYRASGWRRTAAWGPYVGDPTSVCFGKTLR